MTKISNVLMAVALVLGLSACGADDEAETAPPPAPTASGESANCAGNATQKPMLGGIEAAPDAVPIISQQPLQLICDGDAMVAASPAAIDDEPITSYPSFQ